MFCNFEADVKIMENSYSEKSVGHPPATAVTEETSPPSAFPTILGVSAIIFALDQMSKFLVLKHIPLGGAWDYLPGLAPLFRITFITNTGAAFGILPQMGSLLMVVAVVVIIAITFFYRLLPTENVWARVALGLQLGGAMGNFWDRVTHGYVVDFIDISFWPIFNIADVSIVIGVAILAYFLWQETPETEKPPPTSSAPELEDKSL